MTRVRVLSDFNAELVSRYLEADPAEPVCTAETAPFGQLFQSLQSLAPDGDEVVFVWSRPEGVSPAWAACVEGAPLSLESIEADVDAFIGLIVHAASKVRALIVASWVPTRVGRGLGMLDWSADGGARLLARMNLRLADAISDLPNAWMLDAQKWLDGARPARESRFWHAIKSPFSELVSKAAARDIKAALRGINGRARKLLLLDLDNTLWGGVVGDDGWKNLRLGGHDAVGEAHADLQRAALALSRRGIALGVVSKNDEATALTAIDSHPEMTLRCENLAGWRINWQDKAANIVSLTEELNLGLDAVVFFDDNPTERGRVREALPQVLVPELPANPATYADILRSLDCFDTAALTSEDRARAEMYATERTRRAGAAEFSSPEEWLASLEIRVAAAGPDEASIKRIVQLLNKTNQLNLATRRFSEEGLLEWLRAEPGRALRSVAVADRFGDLGLTGIVSWQAGDNALEIVDFVLSCRAMGRMVEETMVAIAVAAAHSAGADRVLARFRPTERNGPCLAFWRQSGFEENTEFEFSRRVSDGYPVPGVVTLEERS